MRTTFVIKRIFESRLPAPYSDCRVNATGSDKIDKLNKPYHQSECLIYCSYYLIAGNCNLLDKFLDFSYLYYNPYTKKFTNNFNTSISTKCNPSLVNEAVYNFYKVGPIEACKKICPVQCNTFSFFLF